MKLEGEKIYLKPISAQNAEDFLRWVNDPDVNKYMVGINPPKTVKEESDWIKEVQNNPDEEVWSIFIKGWKGRLIPFTPK